MEEGKGKREKGAALGSTTLAIAAPVVLVAWGALAFGSVYPWAYMPLLAASALTGGVALLVHRSRRLPDPTRVALIALVAVLAAGVVQLIPLPAAVIEAGSPKTDAFLASNDLGYAFGSTPDPSDDDGANASRGWHSLSLDPRQTMVGLGLLAAFTLLLAGLTTALSRAGSRRLTASIVVFGVVLALIGIIQKAVLGDHAWGGMKIYGFWQPYYLLSTPFGPYVNKNHFAGWMLMGLPLGLGLALGIAEHGLRSRGDDWRSMLLWLSSPKGGRLQLTLLATLLMGASLLMTKSRSGLGGLIVVVLVMSIAAGRRFKSAKAGMVAFGSLAAVFALVFALAGDDLAARISGQSDAVELRKNIWSDSATIIKDFPLVGTGLNTFATAMTAYQTTQKDQYFQEAHNDYIQIIVEGGILLALPAFTALLLLVRAVHRRFTARQDDTMTHWIRVGATTGLIAIALQSLVEFSLQMPGNAVFAVVLLSLSLHETPLDRGRFSV